MDPIKMIEYLTKISNNNIYLNLCMHILVFGVLASLFFVNNGKLKNFLTNGTILILCTSVVINAIMGGNPFHIVTFATLAVAVLVALIKDKKQIELPQKKMIIIISFVFIIMGLWYPEFVAVNSIQSFFASPLGIVPCPTLITILGIMNLCYPKVKKTQFIIANILGVIYGFIGTFKFGVIFDMWLIGIVIFSIINICLNRTKSDVKNCDSVIG